MWMCSRLYYLRVCVWQRVSKEQSNSNVSFIPCKFRLLEDAKKSGSEIGTANSWQTHSISLNCSSGTEIYVDTSKRPEAIITSTKETLSGTSWSCLSDFCHCDKMTLSHFGSLGKIRKAYRKFKNIIKEKMWGNVAFIFLTTSLQTLFF